MRSAEAQKIHMLEKQQEVAQKKNKIESEKQAGEKNKGKNKQDGAHTKLRSMVNGIVDVTMLVSHLSSALQILDKGLELARQYSENNANCRMVNKRGEIFAAILNQCKTSMENANQDANVTSMHIKAVDTLVTQFKKLYALVENYQDKHWTFRQYLPSRSKVNIGS